MQRDVTCEREGTPGQVAFLIPREEVIADFKTPLLKGVSSWIQSRKEKF